MDGETVLEDPTARSGCPSRMGRTSRSTAAAGCWWGAAREDQHRRLEDASSPRRTATSSTASSRRPVPRCFDAVRGDHPGGDASMSSPRTWMPPVAARRPASVSRGSRFTGSCSTDVRTSTPASRSIPTPWRIDVDRPAAIGDTIEDDQSRLQPPTKGRKWPSCTCSCSRACCGSPSSSWCRWSSSS